MTDKKFRNYLIIGSILIVISSVCCYAFIEYMTNVVFSSNPDYDPVSAVGMIVPMTGVLFITITVYTRIIYRYVNNLIFGLSEVSKGNYDIQLDARKSGPLTEVYRNFNMMVEELNKTQYMNKDFMNNFSHEFKTPIVSINGFADLLLNTKCSHEEQIKYLKIIFDESNRLSNLSNNSLLLSKLENQNIVTDKKIFQLDEQLKQCIILFHPMLEKKNIDLDIDIEETNFLGNNELLNRALLNIISNAIKYTDDGGMIEITLVKDKNITISIKDSGIGMTKDQISQIFDKFYQADTSHANKGLGLGLAIAKRIIYLHDGVIEVDSEYGVGTEFKIKLPLSD